MTEVVCKKEEDVASGSSRGVLRDCNARVLSLNEDFPEGVPKEGAPTEDEGGVISNVWKPLVDEEPT